jgi:hypothetical protein
MDDFCEMNLPLNMATWMSLHVAVTLAKKNIPPLESPPLSLDAFLTHIKRARKRSGM